MYPSLFAVHPSKPPAGDGVVDFVSQMTCLLIYCQSITLVWDWRSPDLPWAIINQFTLAGSDFLVYSGTRLEEWLLMNL